MRIEPLTGDTWEALSALFREGGDPRWCWCQFWRLRSKDMAAAKVPELRERLHAQALTANPPGLVAFEDIDDVDPRVGQHREPVGQGERAVGWVSLGPRTDFERIEHSRVIPRIDDRPVWSIVCFAVSATARGRGVGAALLEAAIAFAGSRGATAIEAYPVTVPDGTLIHPDGAFTGTLPMFERLGFEVVADRASDPSSRNQRVVVRLELGPG